MQKRTVTNTLRSLTLAGLAGILSSGCVSSPRPEIAESYIQGKALQRRVFDVTVSQPESVLPERVAQLYQRVEGLEGIPFPVYASRGVEVPVKEIREFCAKLPDSLEQNAKGVYFCTQEDFDNTRNQFPPQNNLPNITTGAYAVGQHLFFKPDKFTLTQFAHELTHALTHPQLSTRTQEWLQISELSLADYTEKSKETTQVPSFGVIWNEAELVRELTEEVPALEQKVAGFKRKKEMNDAEFKAITSSQVRDPARINDYHATSASLVKENEELNRLKLKLNSHLQIVSGPRGQFPRPYCTVSPDEHMAVLTELIIASPEEAAKFIYQSDTKTRETIEKQVTYLRENGFIDDSALNNLNSSLKKTN